MPTGSYLTAHINTKRGRLLDLTSSHTRLALDLSGGCEHRLINAFNIEMFNFVGPSQSCMKRRSVRNNKVMKYKGGRNQIVDPYCQPSALPHAGKLSRSCQANEHAFAKSGAKKERENEKREKKVEEGATHFYNYLQPPNSQMHGVTFHFMLFVRNLKFLDT